MSMNRVEKQLRWPRAQDSGRGSAARRPVARTALCSGRVKMFQ